jgi:hypothetical protein
MIAPWHAQGLISWNIQCTDDSGCKKKTWTLSGEWQVEANFDIPVRVNLLSAAVFTAYKLEKTLAMTEEASRLGQKYIDPIINAYQTGIDPTTWCLIMPRQ